MKRTAFFISDSTGITAETLGNSLLSQFDGIQFTKITLPYIDTLEKAQAVALQINAAVEQDQVRPIILDTIVNDDIRAYIAQCNGMMIDVFATFLKPLEKELGVHSTYTVGKSRSIQKMHRYRDRIESVNFAIDNDDGARIRQYDRADIILVGVSRSGKTPSCLYMALQYGIRAANYPFTEEDLALTDLPGCLEPHRKKLYGLTIDPFQLAAIRHERRPNSRYASLDQCTLEVRTIERLFRQQQIPCINTTTFSVEEIATRIISDARLARQL
jgi:hypothetical protein